MQSDRRVLLNGSTDLGDDKTAIRSSLLIVFSNQVIRRERINLCTDPSERSQDDPMFQIDRSDGPWREKGI